MLTNRTEILKAALKSRIACLNLSKASIEGAIKIGIGRFEDLQMCVAHIKETEEVLAELEEMKA